MLEDILHGHREQGTRPLIVGELNPYGGSDDFALYPAPDGCAGHRLCNLIMGLSRAEYLRRFDRVNLCRGRWSIREARDRAAELERGAPPAIVLLGAKVCSAFGTLFIPFTTASHHVILPHPSGRCRLWSPGAVEKARAVLRRAGVLT